MKYKDLKKFKKTKLVGKTYTYNGPNCTIRNGTYELNRVNGTWVYDFIPNTLPIIYDLITEGSIG